MSLYLDKPNLFVTQRIHAVDATTPIKSLSWLKLADALTIGLTSIFSGWALHSRLLDYDFSMSSYLGVGVLCSLTFVLMAQLAGLYERKQLLLPRRDYLNVLFCWFLTICAAAASLYLLSAHKNFPPAFMWLFGCVGGGVLLHVRTAEKAYIRRAVASGVMNGRPAAIVGTDEELAHLTSRDLLLDHGVNEVVRVQIAGENSGEDPTIDYSKSIAEAVHYLRDKDIDLVVAVLPWGDRPLLQAFRQQISALPIHVLLVPDFSLRALLRRSEIRLLPTNSIELHRAPLAGADLILKRGFDLVISLLLIVALTPLMILVSMAIVIETSGPVIFQQRRVGLNGKIFRIFKFRSMTTLEDGASLQQAQRGDSRVTKVGRVIRSTSIDELPQLFNVLLGHMSIVGPRPHAVAHDMQFNDSFGSYAWRRNVKPGITGWAQVNGSRGETSHEDQVQRRVELDAWYVANCNFWLDLQILLRTLLVVLKFKNAF